MTPHGLIVGRLLDSPTNEIALFARNSMAIVDDSQGRELKARSLGATVIAKAPTSISSERRLERASRPPAVFVHELGDLRLITELRPSEHCGVILIVTDVWISVASVEKHASYLDCSVFGRHMECRLVTVP
jgi:hypothetical protein